MQWICWHSWANIIDQFLPSCVSMTSPCDYSLRCTLLLNHFITEMLIQYSLLMLVFVVLYSFCSCKVPGQQKFSPVLPSTLSRTQFVFCAGVVIFIWNNTPRFFCHSSHPYPVGCCPALQFLTRLKLVMICDIYHIAVGPVVWSYLCKHFRHKIISLYLYFQLQCPDHFDL